MPANPTSPNAYVMRPVTNWEVVDSEHVRLDFSCGHSSLVFTQRGKRNFPPAKGRCKQCRADQEAQKPEPDGQLHIRVTRMPSGKLYVALACPECGKRGRCSVRFNGDLELFCDCGEIVDVDAEDVKTCDCAVCQAEIAMYAKRARHKMAKIIAQMCQERYGAPHGHS